MMCLINVVRALPAIRAVGTKLYQARTRRAGERNQRCGNIPIRYAHGGYRDKQPHRIDYAMAHPPSTVLTARPQVFPKCRIVELIHARRAGLLTSLISFVPNLPRGADIRDETNESNCACQRLR
jgi:hypothetical protein